MCVCVCVCVQAELSGAPKVYDEFLKALLQAKELQWSPKQVCPVRSCVVAAVTGECCSCLQIYTRMVAILEDWPHLVRIFADFLSPQDAADVNAVSQQCHMSDMLFSVTQVSHDCHMTAPCPAAG